VRVLICGGGLGAMVLGAAAGVTMRVGPEDIADRPSGPQLVVTPPRTQRARLLLVRGSKASRVDQSPRFKFSANRETGRKARGKDQPYGTGRTRAMKRTKLQGLVTCHRPTLQRHVPKTTQLSKHNASVAPWRSTKIPRSVT
jgi:hypothetical protein